MKLRIYVRISRICAARLKENAEEKVVFDRESKELISNISHDLKTPITAVKAMLRELWTELPIRRRKWSVILRPSIIKPMKWTD